MLPQRLLGFQTKSHLHQLTLVCLGLGLILSVFMSFSGSLHGFDIVGLSTASRSLNQFTAVVITCIALIIPLTANLYTPKLVKLYVAHPLIAWGISLIVLTHLLSLCFTYFPQNGSASYFLAVCLTVSMWLILVGALPFLYGVSQFLRPSYFVPMLTRKGIQNLATMSKGKRIEESVHDLFETIDVITNLALTGMNRGDRQLVLLALQALHALLSEIIGSGCSGDSSWRSARPCFVPGLAREGQDYLREEGIWPEAYVLAQMLKVMEMSSQRQHEILAELANQLAHTAQLSLLFQRDSIVELHVMAFNTLMRESIESKDLRKFQNLCYHFRLLIEFFHEAPSRMHHAVQDLIHYGRMARQADLYFAQETVAYDLGELILCIGRRNEDKAIDLVNQNVGPFWVETIGHGGLLTKVGWRSLIRTYWEARAGGMDRLSELLYSEYLADAVMHREQIRRALIDNRALHFEFNDRLMRFAYFSPKAAELARKFLSDGEMRR